MCATCHCCTLHTGQESTASWQLTLCCLLEYAAEVLLQISSGFPVRNFLLQGTLVKALARWELLCRLHTDCIDDTLPCVKQLAVKNAIFNFDGPATKQY